MVKFPIVNVYEKLVSKLGILPPGLVDGVVTVYGTLLNIQQAIDHFIRRGDVSQEAKNYLDARLAVMFDQIQLIAVKLAAFAGFEMPDDVFREIGDALAAKSAEAAANTAAEAFADEADQPNRSD